MTRTEAIGLIRKHARDIVEVPFAEDIAGAFGVRLSDLDLRPIKMKEQFRASYDLKDKDMPSVAIQDLAARLAFYFKAYKEGESMGDAPYFGAGRNAEFISKRAADRLEELNNSN